MPVLRSLHRLVHILEDVPALVPGSAQLVVLRGARWDGKGESGSAGSSTRRRWGCPHPTVTGSQPHPGHKTPPAQSSPLMRGRFSHPQDPPGLALSAGKAARPPHRPGILLWMAREKQEPHGRKRSPPASRRTCWRWEQAAERRWGQAPGAPPAPTLGVLDDVLQQQRVLGQALHFGDDQVLELQAPALRIAFCFLGRREEDKSPEVGSGEARGALG